MQICSKKNVKISNSDQLDNLAIVTWIFEGMSLNYHNISEKGDIRLEFILELHEYLQNILCEYNEKIWQTCYNLPCSRLQHDLQSQTIM